MNQLPRKIDQHYSHGPIPRALRLVATMFVATFLASTDSTYGQGAGSKIDRLIAAGKFDSAELLCREQLSDSSLSLNDRADFTVELMRTLVERGRQASSDKRDSIIESAIEEAAQYLQRDKKSLRRYLVRYQAALIPRLRAQVRRDEMPRNPRSPADPQTLLWLRETTTELQSLREALAVELRQLGRRDPGEPGHLTQKELLQLRARADLETGITYAEQGDAYPRHSEDRVLAGVQGTDILSRLSPTSLSPEQWLNSRFQLLRCLRLKRDWRRFGKEVETLRGTRLSDTTQVRMIAELIRVAIDRQRWDRLTELVAGANRESIASVDQPDYDIAMVEGYLALAVHARSNGERDAAAQWEQRAIELIDDRRKQRSVVWLRRVQSLVSGATTDGAAQSNGSSVLSLHRARVLLRQGKMLEAIDAFEAAGKAAMASNDLADYADAERAAAGVEIKIGRSEAAGRRLRQLAITQGHLAAAAETHMIAIKLAAANGSDDYELLLTEHLGQWPDSSEKELVLFWLGNRQKQRSEFALAIQSYQQITPDFANYAQVANALRDCYLNMQVNDESRKSARRTEAKLTEVAADRRCEAPVQFACALAALEIAHRFDHESAGLARVVEEKIDDPSNVASRTRGRMALILDSLRDGDGQRAIDRFQSFHSQIAVGDPWNQLFQRWNAWQSLQEVDRKKVAPEVLRMTNELLGAAQDPQELIEVRKARIIALVSTQETALALQEAKQLVAERPRDGGLAIWYAELASSAGREHLSEAIGAWRRVVAHSRPQTQTWFRAKFQVIRGLSQSGDRQRANEMARMLQTLYPSIDGEVRRDFDELLVEIGAN